MKDLHSQNYQMQSELMQLLKSIIVMTFFSWIGFNVFLGELPSLFWPILGCICFLFALALIRSLKRAYKFYWIAWILALINAVILFESSLRLIFIGGLLENLSLIWLILFGLGMTIFGFWSQFQFKRSQLRASLEHNIKSGRLDLDRGYWNFDMPLHFDLPKSESKKMKRLNRISQLSPLVAALGLLFARAVDGGWQTVSFGACLYVLGCVVAWGSTKYLAVIFQIKDWEKEFNTTIQV